MPVFWHKKHIVSYFFLPLSLLYWILFGLKKMFSRPVSFNKVTITIGNVTVGGAGKTPTALLIEKLLKSADISSVFLTRGYLGDLVGPEIVKDNSAVKDVGDEALLLSNQAKTIVSKKKYLAKNIVDNVDSDCVIMDDGLQNFRIVHHIRILVIDTSFMFGNGFLIPAGPLRQGYRSAMQKADYIFYVGDADVPLKLDCYDKYSSKSFIAKIEGKKNIKKENGYFAFSGISNNRKFFNSLKDHDYSVYKVKEFPDHYDYGDEDIEDLIKMAGNLRLITTSKDMVKIPKKYHEKIIEFKIELKLTREKEFLDSLKKKVKPNINTDL